MKVSAIMTAEPITISAAASLDEALRLMDAHDIRHLPVLEDGHLAGMLSDRELLESTGWKKSGVKEPTGEVRAHMRVPVEIASPTDDVGAAATKLSESRSGCLAVVSRREIVGGVSDIDVMRAFVRARHDGTLSEAEDPSVSEVLDPDVVTISTSTTAGEARKLMRFHHVRHLPIVDHQSVVGLVSDRDLRLAIGRGLSDETPVNALVPRDVVSIAPDEPLSKAASAMLVVKLGSVVVQSGRRFDGLVTSTDVLEHCAALAW